MLHQIRSTSIPIFLAVLLLSGIASGVPRLLSYQGRLADSNGDPLTGTYNLEFFLYDVPVGGSSLWSESHLGVSAVDGLFDVVLGETSTLSTGLFAADELYLTIKINGGAETTPRQQFLSVPFSQRVETVDGSSGGVITTPLTVQEGLMVGRDNTIFDSTTAAIGYRHSITDSYSSIAGGYQNEVTGKYSHIGGGSFNKVLANTATIAGGSANEASFFRAAVVGGSDNIASGNGSIVGGGQFNSATANYSGVLGGSNNHATGDASAILGGSNNQCTGSSSFVLGGSHNDCFDSYATILGGAQNTNSGSYSVILGGTLCSITDNLGAPSSYSLIFGDNVDWGGAQRIVGFFDGTNHGRFAFNRDGTDGGASYPIHVGTNSANGNGARLTAGGVWTNASSKEFKENFTPLEQQQLLDAIESLSIEGWNYRSSDEYHIGPYAEEFVQAFGVGTIDEETGERVNTHLAAGDVAGVALAAVKELIEKNRSLEQRIGQLEEIILQNKLAKQ